MPADHIQWEKIPSDLLEKWLTEYSLQKWPFPGETPHEINREKVQRIYSEIQRFGSRANRTKRRPKDPDLNALYGILSEVKCAVFDDERMKKNINRGTGPANKTCELAVSDLNGFIKTL